MAESRDDDLCAAHSAPYFKFSRAILTRLDGLDAKKSVRNILLKESCFQSLMEYLILYCLSCQP